ncbi:putative DNA-binding transcriptional regulator AlpA [Bradyrhizobium barranii subsp. barranii]|uniref:helix-turn-helix transcriptional regulator n=1 Tax=Bradyrhizobium TaxID=374 RepID=UPI001BAD4043|nr:MULTISPECIES: AlpA family phage regulatory protein [Bradyrhizobium]MBR0879674.1 AlpA family phage regulatory protein [Bradyrhizobium liaoningense]MCP1778771.1 putative DNA-binding transcriptional regulator AlpA [Bradyrhizobium japonicum]MCP1958231.1 putative DNA-binding transcriptional regulator AlpA [Bradyrhizobium japonicum]
MTMIDEPKAAEDEKKIRRMLTADQVLELIPISRAKLHRMEHDGRFPRGHMMGPHRKLWFEDEVIAWQESLVD